MTSIPADDDPVALPTGEEVYDSIMGDIEPELTSVNLQKLEDMYEGETEEEKQARAERYAKAFEEYDKRYAEYENRLKAATNDSMRAVRSSNEASESSDADAILAA